MYTKHPIKSVDVVDLLRIDEDKNSHFYQVDYEGFLAIRLSIIKEEKDTEGYWYWMKTKDDYVQINEYGVMKEYPFNRVGDLLVEIVKAQCEKHKKLKEDLENL